MLKKLGNTKVISDDGREIRVQFQWDYIVYKENHRALYIGICEQDNMGKVIIKIDALHDFTDWLPPNEKEELSLKKKMEIINFLEKSLKILGYDFEIINKPDC